MHIACFDNYKVPLKKEADKNKAYLYSSSDKIVFIYFSSSIYTNQRWHCFSELVYVWSILQPF